MFHEIPDNKIGYAMQQLSSKQRDILVLVSIKGMSYHDAAMAMNMSVLDTRRLLMEAREALQAILDTPVSVAKRSNFIPPYQKVFLGNALYAA